MLKNYFKLAVKVLLRRKFFTFISLFAIAFTLLVLTLAVAMLDHLFWPRAPETALDRMLGVQRLRLEGPEGSWIGAPGYRFLDGYVRPLPGVENVTLFTRGTAVSWVDGQQLRCNTRRTDGQFWEVFDFEFLEGGPFLRDDEAQGNFVAVINATTRRRFFGADARAVGRDIDVGGQSFRVVGVVRDVPIVRLFTSADVWMPISTMASSAYRHEFMGDFNAAILARDKTDLPRIQAAFDSMMAGIESPDPAVYTKISSAADTPFENVSRELFGAGFGSRHPVKLRLAIAVAMVLFMLLPALNLMNINLSRILERASEIGVRKAFGASRWVLVGQFVVENVLLTVFGGSLGFVLSELALRALNTSGLIPYSDFSVNLRVFGCGLLIAVFFGLLSGVYPAWRMSRLHPVAALQGRSL